MLFKVYFTRQSCKKLFIAILYLLSEFSTESAESKSRKKYFLFFLYLDMYELVFEKRTYYGDFNLCTTNESNELVEVAKSVKYG